ncbi:heme-degrading monooxygenase HmoA [Nocardia sp. GAS34]|jgi:heme-degrading monooxygenase HmoA|uniref:antibiotic biosynthesis monooxygenase family protein n=1 Tax=unclassified Nocardia TaxID=2637762 RepID=UPI003D1D665B
MTQLDSNDDDRPVTLINVFEVPADQVDEAITQWRIRAQLMASAPGFRDSRLHRAISSTAQFQLVNVAHWDSRADLEAAQADPAFRAMAENAQLSVSANPAAYEVVVELLRNDSEPPEFDGSALPENGDR